MKRKKYGSQMSILMWIGFTGLAALIVLLFWFILSTSMRYNYKEENIESLQRSTWSVVNYYGTSEFESNLQILAQSEGYNIALISEGNDEPIFAFDSQGNPTTQIGEDTMTQEELFALLDENKGYYSAEIEDSARNSEWAVTATVIANLDGHRQVLILNKSLENVDAFIQNFRYQILYALLAAVAAASLLALALTRFFAGPINKLTKQAEKLVQGEYKTDFPEEGYAEVRHLAHTLEMAAEKFDETDTMRKEFIANVSHDMKTPLTIIKMYTEMLQTVSGDNPEKRAEHLKRIDAEVNRLTNFVMDNLELARLQIRNVEVVKSNFDLSELADKTAELLGMQDNIEHPIFIEEHLPEHAWVYADYKLISRVLQNLIGNALKFSKNADHIDVSITKEPGLYRVSVRDYGVGIAKENLPYVWERYYKVNAYGGNKTGTGIGLHIVKEIMDIHECACGVISEEGKGSEFWFVLPQGEAPEGAQNA